MSVPTSAVHAGIYDSTQSGVGPQVVQRSKVADRKLGCSTEESGLPAPQAHAMVEGGRGVLSPG